MRQHFMVSVMVGVWLAGCGGIDAIFAQSTGPGTQRDNGTSETRSGLGNSQPSERDGSSATVDQGLTKKKKARKAKPRRRSTYPNKKTDFREGSGMQSGSPGARPAPAPK